MNNRRLLALLLALVMAFSLSVSASAAVTVEWDKARYESAAAKIAEVPADLSGKTVILHTNDVHGATAQYAKLAALKADFAAAGADVILVDAGDYINGELNVSLSKGATAIELMNAVGYDYATLGNHEFDWGWDNLQTIFGKKEFTVLTDVQYNGEDAFQISDVYTSEESGLKIGFLGLTTPETATKAHPGKTAGVTWPAEAKMMEAAQGAVASLKDEADLVIAITHLGVDLEDVPNSSRDLYKEVSGLDFIIDGHSHTVMTKGEDNEPIASTGTKLVNVGVIVIDNETKKIESNCLFDLADYAKEDEEVKAINDGIEKTVEDKKAAIIGVTGVDLNGERAPGNRTMETNLGDLISDAWLWYIKAGGADSISVPVENIVAINNGGGIRASIEAGDITMADIYNVMTFDNTVAVVYVTGAELLEALEASTYCTPREVGAFPQVSGIEFTVDTAKAYDQGDQYPGSTYYGPKSIQRVTITDVNGKAFDEEATYAVVTHDFAAAGGDTYYAFAAASAAGKTFDTSVDWREPVIEYITTTLNGRITAAQYGEPAGRITVKADPLAQFSDVDTTAWYAAAVRYAVENKHMSGSGGGIFDPNGQVTRGMVMTILARMEGVDTTPGAGQQWYDKGVAWAVLKGISDGTNPTQAVTREQFATMLYRYEQTIKDGGFVGEWYFPLDYPDAGSVSTWADEAMHWVTMEKVVNGIDGKLVPQANTTRAQVAQMLLNYSSVAK